MTVRPAMAKRRGAGLYPSASFPAFALQAWEFSAALRREKKSRSQKAKVPRGVSGLSCAGANWISWNLA